ncbi:nitric oxide synthase [Spodoptera frugiperda]|uniref:Nitric oxide synthase n=1 Tax=Spodoptera frugiperda TaxID=7108 RepID=A0A9R0D161_SPOFR|nr:nitric oxide synthase [Spodoptera frugiperda]
MAQQNGFIVPSVCPFSGLSAKINGDVESQKSEKPALRIKMPQPIELVNHDIEGYENYDTLHSQIDEVSSSFNTRCTEKVCQSSIMSIPGREENVRTPEEVYKEAKVFLSQYYASIRREDSEAHRIRLEEVKKELDEKGTYQLKSSELVFGAKLAWRNATRCIGRIQWKKLQMFDCREVTTASGMFEALCTHIKYGTNKGQIRSAITIFPQRTDGKHDYRIWNPQLISYAGYRMPDGSILGDPGRVEFTDVCLKLGWNPKEKTAWDILPLVLSADGKDPEYFEIPREIVMEVRMGHPRYDWFPDLDLRWYALPAVSGMRMDCGGLEFTATAFNGWYMGTEIGCRNFCDSNRFNILETIATKMGLDTNMAVSLWKDRALVEVNIAVLHSFHRDNVSIVDHHSASEQFMKHMENESRARGGCPSDWIWIVPPMSSSLTPVFHQEMALYYLRPSYDYQEPAWKTHQWSRSDGVKSKRRKFHFKQIARAVKFTSKLFGRALSKRIKATILFASETGKSEQYAKELGALFGHAFNAQVQCMSKYDMFSIEHETLLIIVASTFGNGEPPTNGEDFAKHLVEMLNNEKESQLDIAELCSSGYKTPTKSPSLLRTNSFVASSRDYNRHQLARLESNKSMTGTSSIEHIAPLSNVRYAVFALGSSAYPKFCNFGKFIDNIIGNLGGERIIDLCCGDEMYGQEQRFRTWSSEIFLESCKTFCLDESDMVREAQNALGIIPVTEETVRFGRPTTELPVINALEAGFRKSLVTYEVKENKTLSEHKETNAETIFVDLQPKSEIKYVPGDHIGVMPVNRKEIVDAVLERLRGVEDLDKIVQLKIMKETLTPTGTVKNWERYERLPPASIRNIYTRFLDITTPPTTKVLKYLAESCTDEAEAEQINELVTDSNKYHDWISFHYPHLAEVFAQFPSCRPQAALLATLLSPLQPRFYSISSSLLAHPQRVHITVAVVVYKTQNGEGPMHYGVCSNYLKSLQPGDEIIAFIRHKPSFQMPKDISAPLILVGPGTGIAPFRGFWHHRRHLIKELVSHNPGPVWLFFGCRYKSMELYKEEKEEAVLDGTLHKARLALSKEEGDHRKYVQALLEDEGAEMTRLLVEEHGHFYVCGDCKMADDVEQKLEEIIQKHGDMTKEDAKEFIDSLRNENRYHEDIFGITLRTAEVHSASRATAKRTRLESSTQ